MTWEGARSRLPAPGTQLARASRRAAHRELRRSTQRRKLACSQGMGRVAQALDGTRTVAAPGRAGTRRREQLSTYRIRSVQLARAPQHAPGAAKSCPSRLAAMHQPRALVARIVRKGRRHRQLSRQGREGPQSQLPPSRQRGCAQRSEQSQTAASAGTAFPADRIGGMQPLQREHLSTLWVRRTRIPAKAQLLAALSRLPRLRPLRVVHKPATPAPR